MLTPEADELQSQRKRQPAGTENLLERDKVHQQRVETERATSWVSQYIMQCSCSITRY